MTFKFLKRGKKQHKRCQYTAEVDGKRYVCEYTPVDQGPRGGVSRYAWMVFELWYEAPDEFNKEGSWEFMTDHEFRRLDQIEAFLQKRLERAEGYKVAA